MVGYLVAYGGGVLTPNPGSFVQEMEKVISTLSIHVLGPVRRAYDAEYQPLNFYQMRAVVEKARSDALKALARVQHGDVVLEKPTLCIHEPAPLALKERFEEKQATEPEACRVQETESRIVPLLLKFDNLLDVVSPSSEPFSEVYKLTIEYLPRGHPWRWCEGACRLRGNVSLSPRDVCKDWVGGSYQATCRYCATSCFGDEEEDKSIISSAKGMKRAMKFFIESHVITGKGKLAWVCHICFNRNRYDGGAGPMCMQSMWIHWLTRHEPSNCCGA